jgi:hypothetical protein
MPPLDPKVFEDMEICNTLDNRVTQINNLFQGVFDAFKLNEVIDDISKLCTELKDRYQPA